ncbi:Chlorophyllase [Corchorus olitorius]|uniref:chlorophyllase n=1 Tax=Corchorus olitorius TaxID=93759 RepID=A0A1R3ISM5_9ROSI|nr:Chlorophyllase [Corchorus olitorius]
MSAVSFTTSATTVFGLGSYATMLQKLDSVPTSSLPVPPPRPLLIATPGEAEAGEFAVLIFIHGYLLYNSFYSQLIQHVASHGFIVIAPQLYTVAGPDATEEINSAAAITNWLSKGVLQSLLPPNVKPNLSKLALSGHSRGGKVAFALALEKAMTTLKFSALIGVDPVDGMDKGKQTPPSVLTYVPNSFNLDGMAVMVIGSGLGEVKRNPLFPPCAPKGVNHEDFFKECRKPACYFVAKDYGHLDMLDDDTKGIRGRSSYCLCKNGKAREPMRKLVGGVIVAFLKSYLNGDSNDLNSVRYGHEILPVELQTVEFLV